MAEEEKVMNRWLVVVGGILIQLCLGAIYAWSAFTKKLVDAGYTKMQTQIIFAVGLLSFAVVMAFIGGRWQKKSGSGNPTSATKRALITTISATTWCTASTAGTGGRRPR